MELNNLIILHINKNKMQASLELSPAARKMLVPSQDSEEKPETEDEFDVDTLKSIVTIENVLEYLKEMQIIYGIHKESLAYFCRDFTELEEKVEVAHGSEPIDGEDGDVEYHVSLATSFRVDDYQHSINFKDMMKIPIVEVGDRLLTIVPPTEGTAGTNIYNESLPAKPGKEVKLKTGENTKYNPEDRTIYATDSGQVSLTEKDINVLPVYEVNDDIDLKTGNIDFNGSIVIRGDVPDGFSLKARGDVTIKGLVEAADIDAGGSIFIKEGISALGKGRLRANLDIHVGNVNQGILEAGRDVVVQNSILHSQIIAREKVYCQKGNIIGGSISAGKLVEGKDIGNRLSTKTTVYLGANKKVLEKKTYVEERMKELTDQIKKLELIGNKVEQLSKVRDLSSKERITLLRQRHSIEKAKLELSELDEEYQLVQLQSEGDSPVQDFVKVNVNGIMYPNVEIVSGKYTHVVKKQSNYISVVYRDRDFSIVPL
ncbi:DUF342 domain-containing protein [Halalkalibacillus halophilus]|uniref:DUF342 domain-containing protein n=1 Tax=Halalkalibacillus halophilus TaxID=392827 RepID=UPI0004266EB7|nr:FapA family protein [Halalkalibacillus halophilus]